LLDEIRALGPKAGGSVPVIAMSAFFSQTERARAHYTDFRACLPKPFTPDKLLAQFLKGHPIPSSIVPLEFMYSVTPVARKL
jgi:CheY-like chemotaxis protein